MKVRRDGIAVPLLSPSAAQMDIPNVSQTCFFFIALL